MEGEVVQNKTIVVGNSQLFRWLLYVSLHQPYYINFHEFHFLHGKHYLVTSILNPAILQAKILL